MRLALLAVGRLKAGPERELVARYVGRIASGAKQVGLSGLVIREIEESSARRPEDRKSEEARALRGALAPASRLVALDENGASMTSVQFAAEIAALRDAGLRDLCFLIGGADGLDSPLRQQAQRVISFGAFTLPHQIVRILLTEQIYRAISILHGHPYHRA